jgi:hypothetical protein
MRLVAAYPKNKVQEKAVKAILKAMDVPYEEEPIIDDTAYLLSTKANKKRLEESMVSKENGEEKMVKIDELWK